MQPNQPPNLGTQPCRVCGEVRPLRKRHVFPKLLGLAKTERKRAFRNVDSPHFKRQDGHKLFFLCGECERMLSALETPTARQIFRRYAFAAHESMHIQLGQCPNTKPPSTRKQVPVMYVAESETRNAAACAISSGVPSLPNGRALPFA